MKKIAILGSTGSIGTQTLSIVKEQKDIQVVALAAGRNIALLEEQARCFRPRVVALWEKKDSKDLELRLKDTEIRVVSGMDGLLEIAQMEGYDTLVTAIVGMIGLRPTVAAIRSGKNIALANKETLVTAGHIIMPLAKEMGVSILPVDSEHSAIFQSLQGEGHNAIAKILLTASGGPFRGKTTEDLAHVTLADALRHPNWVMGQKITIDSATLVNKGLEVIEAKWLFGVEAKEIQVVIHPQSAIHSMVEYEDGAIIGQIGTADMRLPIQYALFYPHRRPLSGKRLDLFALKEMTFEKPDEKTFRGLEFAYRALEQGGNAATIFNAANEEAVALFLEEKIPFLGIYDIIQAAMEKVTRISNPNLEEILATQKEVQEFVAAGNYR